MDNLEPYVEYHGNVLLKNAIDSHSTGLKAQFRLRDDDDLDTFKKITKRRKGRAGQIYRMHFKPILDEVWLIADIFFLGATWSHNNGAIVAFEFSAKEEWQDFRDWPAIAEGKHVEAKEIEIILFQVNEAGELVNKQQRDRMEIARTMKGGPQSIRAARLSTDREFLSFMCQYKNPCDSKFAEQWIKTTCNIESRKELDHDADALDKFNKLVMKPFNRWRGDR